MAMRNNNPAIKYEKRKGMKFYWQFVGNWYY